MEANMNTVRIQTAWFAAMLMAGSAALAVEPAAGKNTPATAPGIEAKVLELTGAETRIVWLRNKQWETSKGGVDGGPGHSIMAFDTGGKGEREGSATPTRSTAAWRRIRLPAINA